MELKTLFVVLVFSYFKAEAQDVKNYSDINFTDIMAYYNGVPFTGTVVDVDSKGNNIFEGTYKNAHPTGEIKKWYSRGNIKGNQEFDYNYDENGVLDGTSTDWSENGQKLSEINYLHGKKDGKASYYAESGKLLEEIAYKNDITDGNWLTYRDGLIRYVNVYVNGAETEGQVFSPEGKPDSIWTYYSADGKVIKTESYLNGVKEGIWTTYDENGNPTITNYHNGEVDTYHNLIIANLTSESLNHRGVVKVSDAGPGKNIFGTFHTSTEYANVATAEEGEDINSYLKPLCSMIHTDFLRTRRNIIELPASEYASHPTDTLAFGILCYNISVKVMAHTNLNLQVDGYYAEIEFNIEKFIYAPGEKDGTNIVEDKHLKIDAPRTIGVIPYPTEEEAFNRVLQKGGDNGITAQISDFLFHNFPVYTNINQLLSKKSDGSASEIQIDQGKNTNIGEGWLMDVYEQGNPAPIGLIETKEVIEASTLCKVKGGGDVIANKLQSGSKLYAVTQTK